MTIVDRITRITCEGTKGRGLTNPGRKTKRRRRRGGAAEYYQKRFVIVSASRQEKMSFGRSQGKGKYKTTWTLDGGN